MATDKKTEQTASVEQRLKALYQLQTLLSEIDRIKLVRGELPLEVKDLEDQLAGLHTRVENYRAEIQDITIQRAKEKEKIENCRNLISRFQSQLDDVQNNRQFDMFTKEIEFHTLEIELAEKHINEYNRSIENKQGDISLTEEKIADLTHILEEKKNELDEIMNETRQEEETLREKAKGLEPKVDERTLTAFKRIRKNARNGLGIVTVERNACGGCFNRIPPQKQMEIRLHKKVIVCEYCGRIMIDPVLAGKEEA